MATPERCRAVASPRRPAALVCLIVAAVVGCSSCSNPPPPGPSTFRVSGTVFGASGSGITVVLSGDASARTTTDSQGAFFFAELPSGRYVIAPHRTGTVFVPASRALTVGDSDVAGQDFTGSGLVCSEAGWCRESPLPVGDTLLAVWGSSARDVWAVGYRGIILHWDGAAWSGVRSGTTQPLDGVWGTSATDVWAVGGGGVILHWNGSEWTPSQSGTTESLGGIWAASAADAWAIAEAGTVLHWDGNAWSRMSVSPIASYVQEDLAAVWGSSASDVHVVGAGRRSSPPWYDTDYFGVAYRWDGSRWSGVPGLGAFAFPKAVWGSSPGDVWAVGSDGIRHGDGSSWIQMDAPWASLYGVWGSSATDVWAVGREGRILHRTIAGWTEVASGTVSDLVGVWGSSASDVWAVGMNGTILHWDGSRWSSASGGVANDLHGAWASPAGDFWAVGADGTLLRAYGSSWVRMDAGTDVSLFGIWGLGSDELWVVGGGRPWPQKSLATVLHRGLNTWFSWTFGGPTFDGFSWACVLGSSSSDVWVGGVPGLLHWDGLAWSGATLPARSHIDDIWGSSAVDVWAVGSRVLHWNGASWSEAVPEPLGFRALGVWGASATDVWAVGTTGLILHWDGQAWIRSASEATDNLSAVWGSSAIDVWAVGEAGTVLHWDGRAWARVESGATANLWDVFGIPSGEVVAVGDWGTILRHRIP